jgi:hypothetical protein
MTPSFSFLMAGVDYALPHPAIAPQLYISVHFAIARALEILRDPASELDFASATEDEITTHLEFVLENRLRPSGEVRGFNKQNFAKVTRESKVTNFNFQRLDKMPDLMFHLQQERLNTLANQDALFAECKPVSKERAAGGHYCDLGISRFINGDYGWAMQDALMVAYVKDGRSIAAHLQPAFEARLKPLLVKKCPSCLSLKAKATASEPLHVSEHSRLFPWPTGRHCCDLQLYHSWHTCK